MKVLISIQHPAHVHFFKHVIRELEEEGCDVRVVGRKIELVEALLKQYNISYELLAGSPRSFLKLAKTQLIYEYKIIRQAKRFDPDVMLSIGEPAVAHAGSITDTPSILFTDTEHATLQNKLAFPFADRVCTPESYLRNIGQKHVRYPGFHELAYLHPDRFTPDGEIYDLHNIDPGQPLAFIRLVSWQAAHDIGQSGFEDIEEAVAAFEQAGVQIRISAEGEFPSGLEEYRVSVPAHRIHDLLAHADVFVGESGTMAIESAVLGTPAIFVSTLKAGVLEELESKYGLLFSESGDNRTIASIEKAIKILNSDSARWSERRSVLLNDKIDTTAFIIDQISEVT